MNGYRAYIIGPDGHILTRVDLVCVDEAEAKERAKVLVKGHDVELWKLDHHIVTLKTIAPARSGQPLVPQGFDSTRKIASLKQTALEL